MAKRRTAANAVRRYSERDERCSTVDGLRYSLGRRAEAEIAQPVAFGGPPATADSPAIRATMPTRRERSTTIQGERYGYRIPSERKLAEHPTTEGVSVSVRLHNRSRPTEMQVLTT